jgi:hypothetical protein
VTFNCQIIWSDGRTSMFGDTHKDNAFAVGGDAVPPFTCVFSEANGQLQVDAGRTSSFTIPAGSKSTDNYKINVAINGSPTVTDSATIAID